MIELLMRRRDTACKMGPYDSQIDYLESTGTQYIEVPCVVSSSSSFAVGGEIIAVYNNNSQYNIFSADPVNQFRMFFYSYSSPNITYATQVGGNSGSGGMSFLAGEKRTFELSTSGKTVNGTYTAVSRPLKQNISRFLIFSGTSNNRYPVKFSSFYIKVGGEKIYDFIPVRVGQVGYLYDTIGKQLYGNKGTGKFTLGPDIV